MQRSRPVGRPSVWHKPIVDFLDSHGSARALEIRRALGISKPSFYKAVSALVCQGYLYWQPATKGNFRFLKTRKNEFSDCLTSLLQFRH